MYVGCCGLGKFSDNIIFLEESLLSIWLCFLNERYLFPHEDEDAVTIVQVLETNAGK